MGFVDPSILIFCCQWWMVRLIKDRKEKWLLTFQMWVFSKSILAGIDIRPHFVCLHKNCDNYCFLYAWKLLSYHLFFCPSSLSHSLCFFFQAENDLNELRALMHSPNAIVVSFPRSTQTGLHVYLLLFTHHWSFWNSSCCQTNKTKMSCTEWCLRSFYICLENVSSLANELK